MITYERLKTMIPADQALANKALQASFEQVKGIAQTPMSAFANTVAVLETNNGLNLINSLTEAVPSTVRSYIQSTVATGTGPNGTLTLGDVLGCGSGYNITNQLNNVRTNVANINIATLTIAYSRMLGVLDGTFGNTSNINIPAGPGFGNYANANAAINSLCSSANSIISGLVSSYPNAIANINSNWLTVATSLRNQVVNLAASQIDYSNLSANQFQSVQSFAFSLHDYGLDTEAGGPAEYLVAVANTANQGGQAVIGAMREGRNIAALNNGGLGVDSTIQAVPSSPPGPGNIGQPNYTSSQAVANIITS